LEACLDLEADLEACLDLEADLIIWRRFFGGGFFGGGFLEADWYLEADVGGAIYFGSCLKTKNINLKFIYWNRYYSHF
jgi:hypothetical protein